MPDFRVSDPTELQVEPLTQMERTILELVSAENWPGFRTDGVVVVRRENTGAGRFTYLQDLNHQLLQDGTYGVQERLLELEGVRDGAAFVVDVTSKTVRHIEIATYGNESWDGVERGWRIA
jgi:hypothetical protein